MATTLGEIARFLGAPCDGDPATPIIGVNGLKEAHPGELAFLAHPRYHSFLETSRASAVLVTPEEAPTSKLVLRVKDPSLAFARIIENFFAVKIIHPEGIHPRAVVASSARLGTGVAVGACAVIDEDVVIGDRSIVYPGCFIGRGTAIGADCVFYPNVSVRERVSIGNRVFIQSGTVIGSEGFGYIQIDGAWRLIPQMGTVVIEDDVEIGANVTIDRARFGKTVIGRGAKIDNLVQIAHNVSIGEHTIIVAQAGISGSTKVGRHATIAGQAGLVGHIEIGDKAVIAAQAGVMKSVPEGAMVSGYPARPHAEAMRIYAALGKLPEMLKTIRDLKNQLEALAARLTEKKE
jgi:UDP-3-O-[3-hydroxymyristoyl] glucosamine N-acyltransferase